MQRYATKKIDSERLRRHRMEEKPEFIFSRALKPRFDILRNADRIEDSFTISTNPERQSYFLPALAGYDGHYRRIT